MTFELRSALRSCLCMIALLPWSWNAKGAPVTSMTEASAVPTNHFRFDFGAPWGPQVQPPPELAGKYAAKYYLLDPVYTPVAQGFIGISHWSFYDAKQGYGWVDFPGLFVNEDTPLNPQFHRRTVDPMYPLFCDGLVINGDKPGVFRVDLPAGEYVLTVYLGSMALGEDRSKMQVTANGQPLIHAISTAGGEVCAVSRRLRLTQSPLLLSFLGADERGHQISICGFEVRPALTDEKIPADHMLPPKPEEVQPALTANFALQMELESIRWRELREKIAKEGPLGATPPELARSIEGTRALTNLGAFHWLARLLKLDPPVPLERLVDELGKQQVHAVVVEHPLLARALTKGGFDVFGRISGEVWPSKEPFDAQILLSPTGVRSERAGFFSLHSPHNQAVFRAYAHRYNNQQDMASYLSGIFIDEPRGMTYFGPYLGDYSRWSQDAFTAWCARQGHSEWAAGGLPTPAMSEAFYAFHRFRLDSVVLFLQGVYGDSRLSNVPLYVGNGEVGPSHWNHSSLYPPALARAGMMAASWNYDHAWSAKASAEVVVANHEFDGRGGMSTICAPDLAFSRTLATAALSAKPDLFTLYGRSKEHLVYETALLARALGPAQRHCGLYRYAPESLSYPDLVHFNQVEADRWDAQSKWLYEHNLDYRVTYTAALSAPALLIYAPAEPVLTAQEIGDLKAHLMRGGFLLYGCDKNPISPAAVPWGTLEAIFGAEQMPRIIRTSGLPDALQIRKFASAHDIPMNLEPQGDGSLSAVRTYAFTRHNQPWLLLANGSATEPVSLQLPGRWRNIFNQQIIADKATLTLPPGWYMVLQEAAESTTP